FFCCIFTAMTVHAMESIIAWGSCSTMSWYAAPALPWFMAVAAAGALAWRNTLYFKRPVMTLLLLMPAFLLFVEFFCEFGRMVRTYSQLNFGWLAFGRLAALHPFWLRLPTLATATILSLIFLASSFGICLLMIWRSNDIEHDPS
ncbi:MAG TPA: hypothetical protein VMD30_12515, partial [Tepidisphaeraceae bacterium]|nr:hypothetical protein [Tepidisphaeraceae bacterium]